MRSIPPSPMTCIPALSQLVICVLLGLGFAVPARALILRPPEITSVAVDPANPDVVLIHMDFLSCKAALSRDGGLSFQAISENDIPAGLSSNLTVGVRQYVLGGTDCLLRTDNGGATWTSTTSQEFMRRQGQTEWAEKVDRYREEYGSMIPKRPDAWYLVFGLFAAGYLSGILITCRKMGWARAGYTGLQGLLVLLIWVFHWSFQEYMWDFTGHVLFPPRAKLACAMAITARPLPLLLYLLILWPLLPGSMRILAGEDSSAASTRRRWAFGLAVAAGTIFLVFHLYIVFIGYFFDPYR